MTIKQYLHDASTAGVVVVAAIESEPPRVRLRETWFHPQGGGQKADQGNIGPARVVNVRHAEGGEVDHFVDNLDGLEVGGSYPFQVDAEWRELNARYHTAGHLIAGVVENAFDGTRATNGHQWPGEARVEFEGPDLTAIAEALPQLEVAVNSMIRNGTAVQRVGDPFSDRKIQIGTFAAIPCGGTHATSTDQIGEVRLRSAKIKGGLIRVGYELTG